MTWEALEKEIKKASPDVVAVTALTPTINQAMIYWFFIKKDTYVSFSLKDFVPDRKVTMNILNVGLPASAEFFVMSVLAGVLNGILVFVAGTDAVAVYSAGWRVVMMATMAVMSRYPCRFLSPVLQRVQSIIYVP